MRSSVVAKGPACHVSQSGVHGVYVHAEKHGGSENPGPEPTLLNEMLGHAAAGC